MNPLLHALLQYFQNFHHSLPSSILPLRNVLRPSATQYNGMPLSRKANTTSACSGFAKIALLTKNRLTQQKMTGVMIQHL